MQPTHGCTSIDLLNLVGLTGLMQRTIGSPQLAIGLIDGPVAMDLPHFAGQTVRGGQGNSCSRASSAACMHGTFVAGILSAPRGSAAPAICPGCTLLVRSIFAETVEPPDNVPRATPGDLARAIVDSVKAGARVLNISTAVTERSIRGEIQLEQALDYAAGRGVIAVAAAGNQALVGGSSLTQHPSVISVIGCDREGMPTNESNLGRSIGRRGLSAPGRNVTSLGTDGKSLTLSGTSAAAPFVTGAIALLWSEFPNASATEIRLAVGRARGGRRRAITPPLLNAWAAYQTMREARSRGGP
jgi:subtilisin family serine protease